MREFKWKIEISQILRWKILYLAFKFVLNKNLTGRVRTSHSQQLLVFSF